MANTSLFLKTASLMAVAGAIVIAGSIAMAADAKPAVVVKMSDTPPVYMPTKITVKVGDTVEWDNNAATLHDVTTDASLATNKSNIQLPPGAKPFDSGFMPPGKTWTYTFTVPGSYKYL